MKANIEIESDSLPGKYVITCKDQMGGGTGADNLNELEVGQWLTEFLMNYRKRVGKGLKVQR
jgi:hypothetical protein